MLEWMQRAEPYISLVVTARNDDHGGDLLKRMQAFTDGWIEQSNRFALESELVIVEWNQVEGRPPLAEALRWPEGNRYCTVRVITVPPAVHKRYRHAESLGLYQMIAKNVGIRRARGQFILATNIDILFSSELMERLARRDLSKSRMYRIDRMDAMGEIPAGAGIEERLRWCAGHLLRVNAREGTFGLTGEGLRSVAAADIAAQDSGIWFDSNWFAPEFYNGHPYRWVGKEATLHLRAPGGRADAQLSLQVEPGTGTGYGPLLLVAVDEAGKKIGEFYVNRMQIVRFAPGLEPGQEGRVRLHVVGGGLQVDNDPRVLNARVLSASWHRRPDWKEQAKWWLRKAYRRWKGMEKEPAGAQERQAEEERGGLKYGAGWGTWQRLGAGYARWVAGEGELELSTATGWGALEMDLEVGPDAVGKRVRVVLSDEAGRELGSVWLQGRKRFVWRTEGEKREARRVRIRGEREGGAEVEADKRVIVMHKLMWTPAGTQGAAGREIAEVRDSKGAVHLHTNGCGDFTLLSREAWFDLRGYPEFDAFSMNIDSVFCWAAHHAGFEEEMLEEPLRIYHIEHGVGSGWTPEGEAKLYERIQKKKIPWLEYPDVISWARDMNRFHVPFVFNLGNWGLAEDEFEEREIR